MTSKHVVYVTMMTIFLLMFDGRFVIAGDDEEQESINEGRKVFRTCIACHSLEPGRHMTGPSLANIWNRKAGTADNFLRYSDALKNTDLIWTAENLDTWLQDPQSMVPGTNMRFQGINNPQERKNLGALLKAVTDGTEPAGTSQIQEGGMMSMSEPLNLKTLEPKNQVVALNYCKDTYTVSNAVGNKWKFWEFNLRLKTDSSEYGPYAGKPVIISAGMRGDRASIIFSAPSEISAFIQIDCG
jgi:cytochrome c